MARSSKHLEGTTALPIPSQRKATKPPSMDTPMKANMTISCGRSCDGLGGPSRTRKSRNIEAANMVKVRAVHRATLVMSTSR